jgi:hypothetical protein
MCITTATTYLCPEIEPFPQNKEDKLALARLGRDTGITLGIALSLVLVALFVILEQTMFLDVGDHGVRYEVPYAEVLLEE